MMTPLDRMLKPSFPNGSTVKTGEPSAGRMIAISKARQKEGNEQMSRISTGGHIPKFSSKFNNHWRLCPVRNLDTGCRASNCLNESARSLLNTGSTRRVFEDL